MTARVIAVANQKGGVGKTVSSINIAAGFASLGHRTLLIDLDPQGHCGVGLGIDTETVEKTSYHLLCDNKVSLEDVTMSLPWESLKTLKLVPSNLGLALAERELERSFSLPNLVLAKKLKKAKEEYDEIILDCPPALSKLTLNAFLACDMVIIPVAVGFFSIQGVRMLAETLNDIFEETDLDHDVRCLVTRYRSNQTVSRDVYQAAIDIFGNHCFKTLIHENIDVEKSIGVQTPLVEYNPNCQAAEDYLSLCKELVKQKKAMLAARAKKEQESAKGDTAVAVAQSGKSAGEREERT